MGQYGPYISPQKMHFVQNNIERNHYGDRRHQLGKQQKRGNAVPPVGFHDCQPICREASQHNTDNRCRHGNDKRVAKIRQEVPLLKDLHIMLKGQGKEKLRRHFPDQQRWLKGIAHYHIDREDYRKHHKQAKQYFSAYNR